MLRYCLIKRTRQPSLKIGMRLSMNVAQHQVHTLVSIGVLLLFCASCAKAVIARIRHNWIVPPNRWLQFLTRQWSTCRLIVAILESSTDLYIPPPPVDMEMLEPEEVEFTLRRCVERMLNYLRGRRAEAGCDTYTMEQTLRASRSICYGAGYYKLHEA